ncbi:MAG: hypothetical protein ACREJO_01410 [Phycisphaerales bacterium]
MKRLLLPLDELLRGQRTRADTPDDRRLSLRVFLPWAIGLGAIYGSFMGWYALGAFKSGGAAHLAAVTVKLPLLFLATLLVTFPSLYVFNALMGSRLGFQATLRLLVATIVINVTVAASLGPILGLFTLSTTSYPFMVLLNVALLGLAGIIACAFMLRALRALSTPEPGDLPPPTPRRAPAPPAPSSTPPTVPPQLSQYAAPPVIPSTSPFGEPAPLARDDVGGNIFRCWIVIYALVGLQMAWVLRPFIGHPGGEFELLRHRGGSVFEAIFTCVKQLLS